MVGDLLLFEKLTSKETEFLLLILILALEWRLSFLAQYE